MNIIKDFLKSREGYLGIFCVIFFAFLCLTSNFGNDLYSYFKDVSYMLIGGLAACLIIMTANIDISSGTILGIVGFVSGSLLKMGVPIPAVILAAMVVGFINSYILAFITIKFRVPSMVVSLAMIKLHIGLFPLFGSIIPTLLAELLYKIFQIIDATRFRLACVKEKQSCSEHQSYNKFLHIFLFLNVQMANIRIL